jgi:hypothetical protein
VSTVSQHHSQGEGYRSAKFCWSWGFARLFGLFNVICGIPLGGTLRGIGDCTEFTVFWTADFLGFGCGGGHSGEENGDGTLVVMVEVELLLI